MLITGKHTCEKCGNIMEWEYQIENRKYAYQSDRIDLNKHHPETPIEMKNGQYLFTIECKKCGAINQFVYASDIKLIN